MKELTLNAIAKACNSKVNNCENEIANKEVSCVEIDSRKVIPEGVFIATKGEKVDGHTFIQDVKNKGAIGVVCEKKPETDDIPYILVEDSFEALKKMASFYRDNLSIPVIGVTGSVGKTSTKEFVAGTLSAKYKVRKTIGNFNNEVGMPLTILSIREDDEIAVVEMGISEPGEMTRLTEIAKPDTCVITNIGQCHLEKLIDRDGVLAAKTEIFKAMNHNGAIFLNGDDDKLCDVKKPWNKEPIFFGMSKSNDIYATDIVNKGLFGSEITINMGHGQQLLSFKADVPLPGKHMILNALVAAGVGIEYGLTEEEIVKGLSSVVATAGRSNVIKTDKYTIIDDCYNANPTSMKSAINLLNMANTRKVAILGDMFELGENELEMHNEVGRYAVTHGVDVLITIGALSQNMYQGALECALFDGDPVFCFDTIEEAIAKLPKILKDDDSILIKASHGMHLEKIVEYLTSN